MLQVPAAFVFNNALHESNRGRICSLVADGPSCVVRWTFIYFTTSWIDSEHLQRAGPAPAKLMCVYTPGRLGEKPATGEMRPRGPGANHTNTLAVSLNPPRRRASQKYRDKSITFCIWSLSPQMLSHYCEYFSIFFWNGLELQLWLNLSPQSSGEVASGNLFCHRLGLRALPNTDNW